MVARISLLLASVLVPLPVFADAFDLELRYQRDTAGNGRFNTLVKHEQCEPKETAIIVCDVWDLHHCRNAVKRVEEFAPRLNQVLQVARKQGVTIIHAPSDCMEAYREHPARQRAIATAVAPSAPTEVGLWCSRIPTEEQAIYPIDQSDGGEDDEPAEHAEWVEHLKALGRRPGTPWLRQSDLISIDPEQDYLSDRGDEVWNILQDRKIKNVILAGVHVNMCVLGRPFGLRQMVRNGKHTVLMRDMTDTMYNPERWPYVSHFTGTDLIISHIERFVCPTITSDQFLGGKPFRFSKDKRASLAIVMAETLYGTDQTLPQFAAKQLGADFRVSYVFGEAEKDLQLDVLKNADVALISVRRKRLPIASMKLLREFVNKGKPVVGIRTASHAFSIRNGETPDGFADWPEFDAAVLGGNYQGHHPNELKSEVHVAKDVQHPILAGVAGRFAQGGSLYRTSPIAGNARPLLIGSTTGVSDEPVAWTFTRPDGGRSVYTSLGHPDDFQNENFVRFLKNAMYWSAGKEIAAAGTGEASEHWSLVNVPLKQPAGNWFRCAVRLPAPWCDDLQFELPADADAWINGHKIRAGKILPDTVTPDELNLLVVRCSQGLNAAPAIKSHNNQLVLAGRWQTRQGDNASWANIPLPAKFGASTDVVFQP